MKFTMRDGVLKPAETMEPSSPWWNVVGEKFIDGTYIFFKELFAMFGDLSNAWSAHVITLAIIACAFGMMLGPLLSNENRWFGRLMFVLIVGVSWRLMT